MDRTQQRAPSLWEGGNVKAHSPPQLSQRPRRFSEDQLLLWANSPCSSQFMVQYIYIFYFSSIDSNVNIYYQILSMTQRPSPLPSDFQWTLLPLHALMVITFPFSWHQLQLMEQIFRRLSTRQSTSKSDPEHKTPRKEMLFLKHSVILQQICEHHMCVMCIDIRFSCYFCNVTYFL